MLAGGCVFACFGLRFVCEFFAHQPWVGYVKAFAEAAIVGGLADWFAVTALFRHPLGIPIYHTRILPNNKGRIAKSLADFVVGNFLTRDVIGRELAKLDLSERVATYLSSHAGKLAARATEYLPHLLNSLDDEDICRFLHEQFTSRLRAMPVTPVLGKLVEVLTAGDKHIRLTDDLLGVLGRALHANEDVIIAMIRREIPVPDALSLPKLPVAIPLGAVKDRLAELISIELVKRIQRNLEEVSKDPEHLIRQRLREHISKIASDLRSSPEIIARGEEIKDEFLANPNVSDYAKRVWEDIKTSLLRDASDVGGEFRRRMEAAIHRAASQLSNDPPLREKLNTGLQAALVDIATDNAPKFGAIIEETIRCWDGDELARKLELEVGRDLQFVRLNGTLVGGLIGIVIHSLFNALSSANH